MNFPPKNVNIEEMDKDGDKESKTVRYAHTYAFRQKQKERARKCVEEKKRKRSYKSAIKWHKKVKAWKRKQKEKEKRQKEKEWKMEVERRIKNGNHPGVYAIYVAENGKFRKKKPLATYEWSLDAYEGYHKLVDTHNKSVFFPKRFKKMPQSGRVDSYMEGRGKIRISTFGSNALLTVNVPEDMSDDERVTRLRNEDGKWIEYLLVSEGFSDKKILQNREWLIEEKFAFYPKEGDRLRTDLRDIIYNHLFSNLSYSTSRRVVIYSNVIFIAYDDNTVAFFRCKTKDEAKRAYDKMLDETLKTKNTPYVIFLGVQKRSGAEWYISLAAKKLNITNRQFTVHFWK